ncbi:enoyl-CoA hydratase/isomerase family protein [Mycolicibacterium vaccae]|uniref:enoyl-CoA hydratase/isomerase family protein n=1 Tax=Mycolicibacterium vaccae TaxID=1810 RepID=UPI003D02C89A
MLSLDTPARRNSLRLSTVEAIATAITDDPAAPVVLRSQTPGMFCSGADLAVGDDERRLVSDALYGLYEAMVTRPGVVIAVVDGPAVGGGAQLSAAADLRVAGPAAAWKWAGPAHGLAVGAWILSELVGRATALSLMLTQRWLSADDAVRCGLVDEIAGDPDGAASRLVEQIGGLDRDAVGAIKQITSAPVLLERLKAERIRNHACFSGAVPARAGTI